MLILAGDYTAANKMTQWGDFFAWVKRQNYRKKIVVAGNHDGFLMTAFTVYKEELDSLNEVREFLDEEDLEGCDDFEYLCDSGVEFEGLKIWGTPWTSLFDKVNPSCMCFMSTESELDQKFALIPEGLDILVTHGPMHHLLDSNIDGFACGSSSLRSHIDRVKPRFHIFGHIHEQGGNQLMYKHQGPNTWCVNCSYVNEKYQPVNSYVRIMI